jgi:hypothetical protein
MSGTFSPLKVIINPPGVQAGMPGETIELHMVVMNQGDQNAIIDIYFDEAFHLFTQLAIAPFERVALAPQQSIEVSFQVPIPIDTPPGTYDYTAIVDAPQHYPADTPIQHPQQIKVLLKEQTIVREYDPTFSLQPSSNPGQPLKFQSGNPLQVALTVNNRSRRVDSFRVTCQDIDPEWFTIRYPAIGVENAGLVSGGTRLELNPAAVGQIWLEFHPPLDVLAGSYAFTLRLHSENSPELVMLDLVYIQIPPVYRLGLKLNSILDRVRRSDGRYELELTNLGNTVRQLAFDAKTQAEDELCTYIFTPDRVKLLPSKQTIVNLRVHPRPWWKQPLFGGGTFINFQVNLTDSDRSPVSEVVPPQTLVWQSRSWWQFLLLLLFVLGMIGGIAFVGWMLLNPKPLQLVKFAPESRKINENDEVLLNWEIHNFQEQNNLILVTKGSIPSERVLKIAEIVGDKDNLESRPCWLQNRVLSCQNFKNGVQAPGKYTFELKVIDRDSKVVASQTTEEVEIVAKPEPEAKEVKSDKSTYTRGEKVLLDLVVQYPEKLTAIEIVAKAEDGKIANKVTIDSDRLSKNTNCKVEAQKMQLACHSLPIDIAQAGKYQLEVTTISKSKKTPTVPQMIKVEVLPTQLKISSFTLNGNETESIVVHEGETLTLSWKVDGEENAQVELSTFGTVQRSGTKQIPVTPALPAQILLTATDKYGQKVSKGFSVKVEATTTPSPTPSVPDLNQQPNPTSPVPDRQKPTTKPSKDLSI